MSTLPPIEVAQDSPRPNYLKLQDSIIKLDETVSLIKDLAVFMQTGNDPSLNPQPSCGEVPLMSLTDVIRSGSESIDNYRHQINDCIAEIKNTLLS